MLSFLAPYKLYIYTFLGGFLIAGWLLDRHLQYNAGIAHCEEQQNAAQTEYAQGKEKKQEQEKQDAVKGANDAAKQISEMQHEKQILLEKLDSKCSLSDAERVQLDATLGRLQGQ